MAKLKMKLWMKISILAVVSAIFLSSGLLIYRGFNIEDGERSTPYSYNISRNTDYKVYLTENSHYDVPYLSPKNNPDITQYASTLIDYIDLDFSYAYSQSISSNFYTSYSVKAVIIGQYDNSSTSTSGDLWKKNYTLLSDTDIVNASTSTYNIRESVQINYNGYNNEVSQYRAATHLAIDAELRVIMQIKSYDLPFTAPSFNRDKPVSTDEITVVIPLTNSATTIDKKYENKSTGTITPEQKKSTNIVIVVIGIISMTIAGIAIIVLIRLFFKDLRTRYQKELDRIMKNYSDIIAEVEGTKVTEKVFIDIKSFEDLVDIEEGLGTPILYYEMKPGRESWFIIKDESTTYRYVLHSRKKLKSEE